VGFVTAQPLLADPAARRRVQRSWMVYDWANSAYATTAVAVFLGPYLTSVARNAACGVTVTDDVPCPVEDPRVGLLWFDVAPGSYYSFVLAIAIAVQVVVLPLTGAVADRWQRKRTILGVFAFTGSGAASAMYFVSGDRYALGGVLYLVANAAFGASIVVYNAFLTDIATEDERDKVSSQGWALGYLGGGLLLLVNLGLFSAHERLGLSAEHAVRISLLSAGLWWGLFTLVPLRGLPERPADRPRGTSVVRAGFAQLLATLRHARDYPQTLLFLAAYLVYADGIQSAIALSSLYGTEELDLPEETLISAILLVQFVAFVGALVLGRLAARVGAKRVVLASLIAWACILSAAYFLEAGASGQFYALAAAIGFVLGGSQALSRSLFSVMIPRGKEAEYFGLYEISERGTSWLGALIFGLVYQVTGSYRDAIASLVAFFLVGALLLARVDVRRAATEAGNEVPTRV
jgi:UMF1 family MFS transporter